MSTELCNYLTNRGIATSHSTPYHPIGNGQVERYNGIIWKSIRLSLATSNLPVEQWEKVLPQVLHSVRSLLSTATNVTPHERFFNFQRKSNQAITLPSWLSPGPVLLRKFVRSNKNDDLVDEVELTHVNPNFAHIRHKDGRESTVSLSDLAPCPRVDDNTENNTTDSDIITEHQNDTTNTDKVHSNLVSEKTVISKAIDPNVDNEPVVDGEECPEVVESVRRSNRTRIKPVMYGFEDL